MWVAISNTGIQNGWQLGYQLLHLQIQLPDNDLETTMQGNSIIWACAMHMKSSIFFLSPGFVVAHSLKLQSYKG